MEREENAEESFSISLKTRSLGRTTVATHFAHRMGNSLLLPVLLSPSWSSLCWRTRRRPSDPYLARCTCLSDEIAKPIPRPSRAPLSRPGALDALAFSLTRLSDFTDRFFLLTILFFVRVSLISLGY